MSEVPSGEILFMEIVIPFGSDSQILPHSEGACASIEVLLRSGFF